MVNMIERGNGAIIILRYGSHYVDILLYLNTHITNLFCLYCGPVDQIDLFYQREVYKTITLSKNITAKLIL